jgi:hypothetical protein
MEFYLLIHAVAELGIGDWELGIGNYEQPSGKLVGGFQSAGSSFPEGQAQPI